MWTHRFLLSALFFPLLLSCRSRLPPEVTISLDTGSVLVSVPQQPPRGLQVAVAAMQSPESTHGGYTRLLELLAQATKIDIALVQRRSYRETNDMLTSGRVDAAFVCTGGYFDLLKRGARVDVLAVPVVRGLLTYESLIIVPTNSAATRLEDLAGKRFALTDELSLTGYAFPTSAVRDRKLEPPRFFASSYFTHAHDRSVEAVARGLADAASVDGNVYAAMVAIDPSLAEKVRILERSPPFGLPPVVALETLGAATREKLRRSLLSLHEHPEGLTVMKELGFDRFVAPPPRFYDTAFEVAKGAVE